jgi:hypothetical protein
MAYKLILLTNIYNKKNESWNEGCTMKVKIFFLDAALILLLGFFIFNNAVLTNMRLNSSTGRSLEYFSASGRCAAPPAKAHFVKAIYTAFPEVYSAVHCTRPVVHPVSLEQVAP